MTTLPEKKNAREHFLSRIKEALTDSSPSAQPLKQSPPEDDTFSLDIAPLKESLKKFFANPLKNIISDPEHTTTRPPSDEDFSVDFSALTHFMKRHAMLLCLLFIVGLQFAPNYGFLPWGGLWMRLQTEKLPLLDDLAQTSVYNFYRSQISQAISQQYPALPDNNKNKLIDEQLTKVIQENAQQVHDQITQTAAYLKDSEQYEVNGTKYTFMPDIDPYQYLRLAQNYITYGALGDVQHDGVWWDSKILAPLGRTSTGDQELHPYVLAYLYKIIAFFNPSIPLMQAVSYFPIIFVTLSIIFAFLLAQKLSNNVGGILAATALAINPAAIGRTQWGHANTNAYNVFFPMLITWLFVASLETENTFKKYGLIVLNTFFLGLYAFAWAGWWHVFYFILLAIGLQAAYALFFNRPKLKQTLSTLTIYFLGTLFFTALFRQDPRTFINSILSPLTFNTLIKSAAHADPAGYLFPNVYTTVAELNPTSFSGAIDSLGGTFFAYIGILGLILLALKKDTSRRNRVAYVSLLAGWIIATVYATTKGIRFGILIAPGISTLFGIAAGLFQQRLLMFNQKSIHIKKIFITLTVVILFGSIIMQTGQVEGAYSQTKNDLPIMNKAWWNALTAIKENSTQDAIINSWWDFGHHFKYVAERAVTFDGAHQNSPMAHWIGKVLATSDEDEAVALLRMLDCGSRKGYDELNAQTNYDTIKSLNILQHLLKIKKKDDAKTYLEKQGIQNTENVLKYTHCNPPEDYFITSEDMVSKSGVWSHFGLWNFQRAYAWINLRNTPKDQAIQDLITKFNYTQNEAEQIHGDLLSLPDEGSANTWISGWPGYVTGFEGCSVSNETIRCTDGAIINKTTMDTTLHFDQGTVHPRFLSYIDDKTLQFTTKEFNQSPANFAVILVPSGDSYRSVVASAELGRSMFTRLFYMGGHGLKHFKLFRKEHQLIGGGEIYVWKIDWNGNEPNVIETLQQKNKNLKILNE